MTTEEAIRELQEWKLYSNHNYPVGAVDMAIEALKKETPKGVINFSETEEEVGKIGYALCPKCRKFVAGKYCTYCGQKLAYLTIEEERERIKA